MTGARSPSDAAAPRRDPLPALRRLAEKGRKANARAAGDEDWSADVVLPAWLPGKFAAALVSQFHYGEIATSRMCRRLADEVADPDALSCLRLQVADEDRHARFYRRYLERLGDIAPPDPALHRMFEQALAWDGPPEGAVCAFNIIIEGEALRTLDDMGDWLTCPLFRTISARVARDEARHIAFGRLYLAARLGRLDRGQRLDMYRWLKGLWNENAYGVLDRFSVPGFVTRRRRRAWAAAGWETHRRALADVGLVGRGEFRLAEAHAAGAGP